MHMPGGRWDWTRSENSAKAMLNEKLENSKPKKMKPWEEKTEAIELVRITITFRVGYLS